MSVTFTREAQTYDATTDTVTPTQTTITGAAMKTKGDPQRYEQLKLRMTEAPCLLFVPETYGDTVLPGDVCTWNGKKYTARDCDTLAPDGVTILQKVIISQ